MKYYESNPEADREEKRRLDRTQEEYGKSFPKLKLESGTTMVRILPPYRADGKWHREIWTHDIYEKGERPLIFACAEKMAGGDCAICNKGNEVMASREPEAMDWAGKKLRRKRIYLYNAICTSAPTQKGDPIVPGQVYVMVAGPMVHKQIVDLDEDAQQGYNDVKNPQNGVNLNIHRTGQDLGTRYNVMPHAAGRTNVFEDLARIQKDPNEMELINLDELFELMPPEDVVKVAARLHPPIPAAPEATFAPVAPPPQVPATPPAIAPAPQPAPTVVPPATPPAAFPTVAPTPAPVVAPAPAAAAPLPAHLQPLPQAATQPQPAPQPEATQPAVAPANVGQEVPQPPAVPAPPTD